MAFFELVLRVPEALVESLSDALMEEAEALSVSVEDADAGQAQERALFGEPGMPVDRAAWDRSTVRALFEDEAAATVAATLVQAQDWSEQVHLQALQAVPDEDWVRLTQSQFEPVAITPAFWVVPTWHEVPATARTVIRLDPGLAFGTGTHPTTLMCLRWIAAQAQARAGRSLAPWAQVLDYGCGSGILAIAAGLHGAGTIEALDIDPAAVLATQANAQANGVSLRAALPDDAAMGPTGQHDLVLANILATPLKLLAPLLSSRVAPGGSLVLAGILARQTEELQQAYAPWLQLEVADELDGWVLMSGVA